jgi:hypothetical protein
MLDNEDASGNNSNQHKSVRSSKYTSLQKSPRAMGGSPKNENMNKKLSGFGSSFVR